MTSPGPAATPTYAERLRVPWVWWLIPVFFVVVFAVGMNAFVGPFAGIATALLLTGGVIDALRRYGDLEVAVGPSEFRAGRGRLPLSAVGAVHPLDPDQSRALRGPRADARAFLVLRGYVPTAVRVDVADPADRTPYWYVSTRDPQALAAALSAARDRVR
ncbi:MAG: DUF3093 domain-containing protein [Sporichthyaceae bacterium]